MNTYKPTTIEGMRATPQEMAIIEDTPCMNCDYETMYDSQYPVYFKIFEGGDLRWWHVRARHHDTKNRRAYARHYPGNQ